MCIRDSREVEGQDRGGEGKNSGCSAIGWGGKAGFNKVQELVTVLRPKLIMVKLCQNYHLKFIMYNYGVWTNKKVER